MPVLLSAVRWSQVVLLAGFALLLWPLTELARRRVLAGRGWVELKLAGEVTELRREERPQDVLLRKLLRQPEPKRVVLERLEVLVDELLSDRLARGVLVRLGPLGGGWASADAIRKQLARLRDGGKHVIVHGERMLGNRELLVATGGSRLLVPPTGIIVAGGVAAPGLFFRGLLDWAGITVEVASAGRFKSAPDQFTRAERSGPDLEQTRALVDALDQALLDALRSGRGLEEEKAKSFLEASPVVGRRAEEIGLVDGLTLDEDLLEEVGKADGITRKMPPLGAGRYLQVRRTPNPWRRAERHVGVVRVCGNIVDEAPAQGLGGSEAAVEGRVVADLRAALRDPMVASVVLLVDSRGGSVTASDGIWAAVHRVNKEKPVVACFGDVSASGGYYVACGARAIVASPLTVTGSIGVFALVPTWPELTRRLRIGRDVVKGLENADFYDPWGGFDERRRAHAQREVEIMYEVFLERVSAARGMERDAVHAVAEGRVWIGSDAHDAGLVDGLGGFAEAVDRARHLAGGRIAIEPRVVRASGSQSRPSPAARAGEVSPADMLRWLVAPASGTDMVGALLGSGPDSALARELLGLWLARPGPQVLAWAPVRFD